MVVGRPRTKSLQSKELLEFGEKLLIWATEKTGKDDELRFRFPQFYCLLHGYTEDHWDKMKRIEEFRPYYEKARVALSRRYIDGSIKDSIAHRFLRIYFPEIRKEEDETARFNARLKFEEIEKMSDGDIKRLDEMIASIKKRRKSK